MPEPHVDPLRIEPTEDSERLQIEWKDGVVSEYVPRYLRLFCPCAGCVDEMSGVRTLVPESVDTVPDAACIAPKAICAENVSEARVGETPAEG